MNGMNVYEWLLLIIYIIIGVFGAWRVDMNPFQYSGMLCLTIYVIALQIELGLK